LSTDRVSEIVCEVNRKRADGFNCAESTFYGVCRYLGVDMPVSCMTGFGGGLVGIGSVCGALSGAICGLGIYIGRTEPGDEESKARCKDLGQQIVQEFTSEMGALTCHDILGFALDSEGGPEEDVKDNRKKTRCSAAVRIALESAIRTIESDKQESK